MESLANPKTSAVLPCGTASGLKPGKYSGNIMAVVSGEDLFAALLE